MDDFSQVMLEREALVLELLIQEGYFPCRDKLHGNTKEHTGAETAIVCIV